MAVAPNSSIASYHSSISLDNPQSSLCTAIFQSPDTYALKTASFSRPSAHWNSSLLTPADYLLEPLTLVNNTVTDFPMFKAGDKDFAPFPDTMILPTPDYARSVRIEGPDAVLHPRVYQSEIRIFYQARNGQIVSAIRNTPSHNFIADEIIGKALLRTPLSFTLKDDPNQPGLENVKLYALTEPTIISTWSFRGLRNETRDRAMQWSVGPNVSYSGAPITAMSPSSFSTPDLYVETQERGRNISWFVQLPKPLWDEDLSSTWSLRSWMTETKAAFLG